NDESTNAHNDWIYLHDSHGAYTVFCGMGDDKVYYGGKQDDRIVGCGGNDTLDGGEGDDLVAGDAGFTGSTNPGSDYLYGNDGHDYSEKKRDIGGGRKDYM